MTVDKISISLTPSEISSDKFETNFECQAYQKKFKHLLEILRNQHEGDFSISQDESGNVMCAFTEVRILKYFWCKKLKTFRRLRN